MIKTMEMPVSDLRIFHKNPRIGDMEAIRDSLNANGQYRAIVVNKGTHTGRPMEVLAGNHTLKAARDLGWTKVTVHLLDVDEDQATRIVLADNRTAELGYIDSEMLIDLAFDLDDLEGTGYTREELDLLDMSGETVRDLDALADEVGEFSDEDLLEKVTIMLMPDVAGRLRDLLATKPVMEHTDLVREWLA